MLQFRSQPNSSNWSSALAKAPKHARSAGTRAPRLALALAGLGHLSSLERLPFGPHDLPPGRTLLAVGSWCSPKLGRMSVGRYAFRGARGGFLSAAMDRERLVQAPHMGHSELFQLVEADGDIYLKTYYGTYVSIWYDGSAHQTAKVTGHLAISQSFYLPTPPSLPHPLIPSLSSLPRSVH